MRYFYFLLIALLFGCTPSVAITESPVPIPGETYMPVYRYLALGDSYTIGESVAARNRWPDQLAKMLEADGIRTDITIIARTGWTVDDLWQGIQANPPAGTYDLVTLLIGVNDQYRNYPVVGYREDFSFVLEKAIEFAGGDPRKVIVLSIPDWGFTPFAATRDTEPISREIDEFNAVNFEETTNSGANYVNITDISRMAMDDFELIAGDQLHPSGKMYTMWAEKVLPVAKDILK
jgi:lysophospholipase L1-like esterase